MLDTGQVVSTAAHLLPMATWQARELDEARMQQAAHNSTISALQVRYICRYI